VRRSYEAPLQVSEVPQGYFIWACECLAAFRRS